jgi:hypothetical protein
MFRGLLVRTVGTPLFAIPFLSLASAQDNTQRLVPAPPALAAGAEITSQLKYSCPSNTACSFICPGEVSRGGRPRHKFDDLLGDHGSRQ